MERKIKNQQGYLLMVAVVLIIIATFVGTLLVYMFVNKTGATLNNLKSESALYIATSSLEIAKRDIAINGQTCSGINGLSKYTNAALFSGFFTVTGSLLTAISSLSSGINSTDSSVTLNNISGFDSSGVIVIDNELLGYVGISDTTLLNVTRGLMGTVAVAHTMATSVVQNQCALTAVGMVPTVSNSEGKRTIKHDLVGRAGFVFSNSIPAVISAGQVTLGGNSSVTNTGVTTSSSNFAGSTIVTANSSVNFSGSAETKVSNGSGGLVTASDQNITNIDITTSYGISAGNLFSYLFRTSKTEVKASANTIINQKVTDLASFDGYVGPVIWVEEGIDVDGNKSVTLGSISNPVVLIVNGDVKFTGTPTLAVNGVLYVIGAIDTGGTGNLIGNGQIAAEGNVTMQGNGTVSFNSAVLSALNIGTTNTVTSYITGLIQEIFP